MKKISMILVGMFMLVLLIGFIVGNLSAGYVVLKREKCTTIQSGEITGSDGLVLSTGYNEWGYNYQARIFNGLWCDYHPTYRPGGASHEWCMETMANVELMMKWSDEWLSNKDCNKDGLLDRGYSCNPDNPTNSGCPGAWLTNHERGIYEGVGGETCNYNYFVKIVAAPEDATVIDGIWYAIDGTEIGEVIWGAFAIIQKVSYDPCAEEKGILYKSPSPTGLGYYA